MTGLANRMEPSATASRKNSGPAKETYGQWGVALSVSLLAHALLAAWLLGVLPDLPRNHTKATELHVTSHAVDQIAPALVEVPHIPVMSLDDTASAAAASPQPIDSRLTQPAVIADRLPPQQAEQLLGNPGSSSLPASPPALSSPAVEADNLAIPIPADIQELGPSVAETAPPSPLFMALMDAIRNHVTEACLLSFPEVLPDGGVRLTVISANDQQSANFLRQMREVTEGADFEERRVLLDQRQCAAITWLRGTVGYPGFSLGLGLDDSQLISGENLQGRISSTAGHYTTLLLIDDNGVVQDLRRFLLFSGGQAQFDIPVTRAGNARDTGQLLIAIASRDRPASLSQMIGQYAETVFPALDDTLQSGALIGVMPFFVQ